MRKALFLILLTVFLLVSTSTASMATQYTLYYDVGPVLLNEKIPSGSDLNIDFDINNILPPNYNITSATFSFSFSDNNDTPVYVQTINMGRVKEDTNYYDIHIRRYQDPFESIIISYGQYPTGNFLGMGLTSYFENDPVFVDQTLTIAVPIIGYYYDSDLKMWLPYVAYYENYYTCTYDQLYGYKGDFLITGVLEASILEDLKIDGKLSLSIHAFMGDIIFNSASLTLDDTIPSNVPLPSALVLLGSGLLRLAVWRRRRRN